MHSQLETAQKRRNLLEKGRQEMKKIRKKKGVKE
jgi:hypothetical protein